MDLYRNILGRKDEHKIPHNPFNLISICDIPASVIIYYLEPQLLSTMYSGLNDHEKIRAPETEISRMSSPLGGNPLKISWTQNEEKALLRRIDLRILPGLSLLYLLCFLDRT